MIVFKEKGKKENEDGENEDGERKFASLISVCKIWYHKGYENYLVHTNLTQI